MWFDIGTGVSPRLHHLVNSPNEPSLVIRVFINPQIYYQEMRNDKGLCPLFRAQTASEVFYASNWPHTPAHLRDDT